MAYGSAKQPSLPGSSGGPWYAPKSSGSEGGGLIYLVARGNITLNGTLRADGYSGWTAGGANGSGGGSGGGIYLACRTLLGTNGFLTANGGAGTNQLTSSGGGGGGGRIAIWRMYDQSDTNKWLIQVNGGVAGATGGSPGSNGTIYWGQFPPPGTVIILK